jgi:hypothetical protein
MQKVVGSNPIIRSLRKALPGGWFVLPASSGNVKFVSRDDAPEVS